MAAGTPILVPIIVTIAVLLFTETTPVSSILRRRVSAVKLNHDHMELVEEETCSNQTLRMTCRSLKAILIVLEAEYKPNDSNLCEVEARGSEDIATIRRFQMIRNLYGDYDSRPDRVDLKLSINRRCSGLQHCRFNAYSDHSEALFWSPANLRLKYACIPEAAIMKYCNRMLPVIGGEGGFLKSPGYPLFYTGGSTCGWTFKSLPGQRIALTFHDLDIRSPEQDGSCVDVIRIRENRVTLFESCGTAVGVQVLSESNVVTLDLIASGKIYPSRGFLLQYKAVGCPQVQPPNGSYAVNETGDAKTFLCKLGTVFPDTNKRTRLIQCKNGIWSEDRQMISSQRCVLTASEIERNAGTRRSSALSSLAEEPGTGSNAGVFPVNGVVVRSHDSMHSMSSTADPGNAAMMKDGNYVVDFIVPTALIALLFIFNAIIVWVIFQYRKRKQPAIEGEEMALRPKSEELPHV
ncbi:uncharacterized protein LOC107217638 [Neodiprion lecontei]|uniref:Uncharacterized protein LOC107217638 n=1 Tax=Neodiprion lecontei TaxID=441921 RepID=A0ABM3G8X6_NEOLC|nr:uncharacterized protein LOC107217638 [Neodiprion lecontei]